MSVAKPMSPPAEGATGRLTKDITHTLVTRIGVLGLGFGTSIMLARLLGSAGIGEYALIMTTLNFMMLCSGLGLDVSNVYYAGQAPEFHQGLVANSLWLSLAAGGVAAVLFFLCREVAYNTILQGVASQHVILGLIALPLLLLRGALQGILRGKNLLGAWNGTTLLNALLLFVLPLGLVGLGRLGVGGAMLSQLLAGGVMCLVLLLITLRAHGAFWRLRPALLRGSIAYGLKMQVSTLVNYFNYSLNYYLLNTFLSIQAVGHYSVAVSLTQPLLLLPTAIHMVVFPHAMAAAAEEARRWMPVLLRQTLLLMLGLLLLALLVSRPLLLRVYGPEYASSVHVLHLLLPGCLMASLDAVMSAYACARGKPEWPLYATVMGVLVTLLCGRWWIPRYGLEGAGWTASTAFAVMAAVECVGYLRISGNGLRESFWPRRGDVRQTHRWLMEILGGAWRTLRARAQ